MRNFLYVVALALRPSVDPRSSKHPSRQLFTPGALGGLSAARLVMLYIYICILVLFLFVLGRLGGP